MMVELAITILLITVAFMVFVVVMGALVLRGYYG
jgi:hypothetical protein